MQLTDHEKTVIGNLEYLLLSTECIYTADLIGDDPKVLRGALSSLVKKDVLMVDDIPSVINGRPHYAVLSWDENVVQTPTDISY